MLPRPTFSFVFSRNVMASLGSTIKKNLWLHTHREQYTNMKLSFFLGVLTLHLSGNVQNNLHQGQGVDSDKRGTHSNSGTIRRAS